MAIRRNDYIEARARQNTSTSTQQIDYSLRAVKIYNNIESRAGHKEEFLGGNEQQYRRL